CRCHIPPTAAGEDTDHEFPPLLARWRSVSPSLASWSKDAPIASQAASPLRLPVRTQALWLKGLSLSLFVRFSLLWGRIMRVSRTFAGASGSGNARMVRRTRAARKLLGVGVMGQLAPG